MKRILITVLLMVTLTISPVFAETMADGTENEVTTGTEVTETTDDPVVPSEPTDDEKPAKPCIVKDGKDYYYQDANGKRQTKAGFVKVDGKKYYVRKGGKVQTDKSFKVKKKYYRANKEGMILTGVYKWKKKLNFSNSAGVWKKSEGMVEWNGDSYYVKKGGVVISNDGFTIKNMPYAADKKGKVTKLAIPKSNNAVAKAAKKQVGIMTGKTYWRWYYKTKFIDTDRTPWCGAFVAWCYNKAGKYKKVSVAKKYGPLGYVPSYSKFASRYGKWVNRNKAKGGDIIVFGKNRHVGIVEGIQGDCIITIEGNAGPTAAIGCGKPGAVVRNVYKLKDKDIKGVIRP